MSKTKPIGFPGVNEPFIWAFDVALAIWMKYVIDAAVQRQVIDRDQPDEFGRYAASDHGGITGWLLDLVDTLGPVGVGISILLETVVQPIPSEAVLGLAGVLINQGRMSIVPVILFATLGSVLGALFFYAVGRALGPRRSHAFLDRLPLVETEDVDRTFSWFERHGRSAVFLGRMVPIVRSFISVPAGVVRMPIGRFVLFTAACSLIWNSVLIGLGVAAGDFIEKNLHFLDAKVYYISDLPTYVEGSDVLQICSVAFILCALATIYPAWRASRTAPAQAHRHE